MEKEEKIKKLYEEFDKFYEENEISPYNAAYAYFKAGFDAERKEIGKRIEELFESGIEIDGSFWNIQELKDFLLNG